MIYASLFSAFLLLSSAVTHSQAFSFDPVDAEYDARPHIPFEDEPDSSKSVFHISSGKQISSYNEISYFEQLIDHNNPSKGTFKQRYWHNYEYYEQGGPIVVLMPGEVNAAGFTGYLTNGTISGMIAQATKGSVIVFEHRFFGESNPYPDLSVEHLKVHTIEQSIADLAYFAKNVKLPQPGGDKLAPGSAPWILVGGSYSGALTTYAMHKHPELFWAGYSSSGVVQAIGHFWGYFEPIREWMPHNCSEDVQNVVSYIDTVLERNNSQEVRNMKANFGLQDVVHADDFAAALKAVFYNWQSGGITTRPTAFYDFCDALEVKEDGQKAPYHGWGVDHAFKAWGKYWNSTLYRNYCGTTSGDACFSSHNPNRTYYNNKALGSGRSWKWMTCNEFGFFPTGAPSGYPTIVSRFLDAKHSERDCSYDFPGAFSGPKTLSILNALAVYKEYEGWDTTVERIIFVNGERDPWREATVAGAFSKRKPTELQPHVIHDGFHCSDMKLSQAVSPRVASAQREALEYMKKWVKAWQPK